MFPVNEDFTPEQSRTAQEWIELFQVLQQSEDLDTLFSFNVTYGETGSHNDHVSLNQHY